MSATMNTRLRSASLGRKQSIDTDDGRQSIDDFDDTDVNSIETRGKSLAHLVAVLKEEDDIGPSAPLPPKGITTRRSSTRAIPVPQAVQAYQGHHQASLPSSMESSGSGFISAIMNPQTSTSSALSHTPPTQTGTSYEMQHFGKRPRSGVCRRCASLSNLYDLHLHLHFTHLIVISSHFVVLECLGSSQVGFHLGKQGAH